VVHGIESLGTAGDAVKEAVGKTADIKGTSEITKKLVSEAKS